MALPTQPNGSSDVRLETPANATTQTEVVLNQTTGTKESVTILIINQK